MHIPVFFKHNTYRLLYAVILLELFRRGNKNHFKMLGISKGWKGTGGNTTALVDTEISVHIHATH